MFLIGTTWIKLFKFNSHTQNVIPLQSVRTSCLKISNGHSIEIWVAGSKAALTVASKDSKMKAVYNIRRNSWRTHTNFSESALVWSHTRHECYYLSKGSVDLIVHLKVLDLLNNCVRELPTISDLSLKSSVVIIRVPKQFCEKLNVSAVCKEHHHPVCSKKEVNEIMARFKSVIDTVDSEEDDSEIDEEIMQKAKEEVLEKLLNGEMDGYMLGQHDLYDDYDDYAYGMFYDM